jgi:ABC-type multidrug transport system ATPase subunit
METLKQRGPKLKWLPDSPTLMISYLRFLKDMKLKWETKGRSYRAGRNSVSPLVGLVFAVFYNYMYVAQMPAHLVLSIFDFCLLARVLVGNPKLLILDEATSALDNESELVVQDALDNILQQKKITTIIVAHRLSTIRNCDIINVLVDGVIVESGTHAALIDKHGYYRKLVEKQDGTKHVSEINSAPSSRCGSEVNLQQLQNGWPKILVKETASIPHIAFNNVTFAYPTRPKKIIFDGFNLDIERGSTVALVGPSGGGKSTTVGLVERFYDPVSGTVEYEGTDVKSLNVHWYRDQIGYVGQEPVLCKCTPLVAAVSYRIDVETHAVVFVCS